MIRKLVRSLVLHSLIAAFSGSQMRPLLHEEVHRVDRHSSAGVMEAFGHCGGQWHLCMVDSR